MEPLVLPLMMYKESGSLKKGTKKTHGVVPTWNHLYQIRQSRLFLDKWAKEHKQKLEVLTLNWMDHNEWEPAIDKKVIVDVWVYWPDARARDCHNIDKIMLDVFEDAGIYDNDANALLRYQDFDIDLENPRIVVEFTLGEPFNRKDRVKDIKKEMKEKAKMRT